MHQHVATLQSSFNKASVAYDAVQAAFDQLYWLDDHYMFNPFMPGLHLASVTRLSVAFTGDSLLSSMSHSG